MYKNMETKLRESQTETLMENLSGDYGYVGT